jgi:SAM-dependent methyltransferase
MITQEFIEVGKLRLPPKTLRWGGPRYADDDTYIRSAKSSVGSLGSLCHLVRESRVLDIGCGQGRLLTGILATLGGVREYVGLDVHKPSIDWASSVLAEPESTISFCHLPVLNERYNPRGITPLSGFAFPVPRNHFDVITLFSVFSHMKLADIRTYLGEIRNVLNPTGKVFCSIFAEYGVQDEEENPTDYHRSWSGPLHCVRINRHRFEELVYASGLIIDYFRYRHTNDGQSSYVLSRADGPSFQAKIVSS